MKKVNAKAPKVSVPARDKPFGLSFKDKPSVTKGKSPQSPMSRKKLSK